MLICLMLCSFQTIPKDGKYKEKHQNGKLSVKGHYKSGLKTGTWMFYDANGKILSKEKWSDGQMLWKAEYEKGRVVRVTDKDGNVHEKSKCGCS